MDNLNDWRDNRFIVTNKNAVRRNLKSCTLDGIYYSLMVGFGETYFSAFALAVGSTDTFAGLINVVPLLVGSLLQLLVPLAAKKFNSYRTWVCFAAGVQSLSLFWFAFLANQNRISEILVFFAAIVYWSASMSTTPAWTAWVGSLIPRQIQIRYFAIRSRYIQIFTLASLLLGGFYLQFHKASIDGTSEFAVIFLLAGLCRMISTLYLHSQSEPKEICQEIKRIPFSQVIGELKNSPNGRLFLYLTLLQLTANISSPYFTPFMLSALKLPYGTFALLIACSFLAKFFALPLWSMIAKKHSVDRILMIGTVGVVFIPALWLLSSSIPALIFFHIYGGFFWAAQELGTFLIFFNRLSHEKRASFMSAFTLLNYFGIVCGSLIGGFFLRYFGETVHSYHLIFMISALSRLMPLLLMPRSLNINVKNMGLSVRIISLRPVFGAIIKPIFLVEKKLKIRKTLSRTVKGKRKKELERAV